MKHFFLLLNLLIITACVPTEGAGPIVVNATRQTAYTATSDLPTPFPTPTYPHEWMTATAEMALTLTPYTPSIDETSIAATVTGAAVLQITPSFIPSPTPVPAFPGIIYSNTEGTWQVGAN